VFDPDQEARLAFRAETAFQRLLVASNEATAQITRFLEISQDAPQPLARSYSTFVRAYDPANLHVLPMFRANWLAELSRLQPDSRITRDTENRLAIDVRGVAITSALASALVNLPAARPLISARDYGNSVLVLKLHDASLKGARFDGAILGGVANFLYTTISVSANAYCDGKRASSRLSLPSFQASTFEDSAILGASPGTITVIRSTLRAGQQRGQITLGGIQGYDPSTDPDPSVQYIEWHDPPIRYSRKDIEQDTVLRDAACFARGGLIDRVRPPIFVTLR
jgi:hypothetical protein